MCVIGGGGDTIGDSTSGGGDAIAVISAVIGDAIAVTRCAALPPSAAFVALRRPMKIAHDVGRAPLGRGAGGIGVRRLDDFGHGDLSPAFEVARDWLAPLVGNEAGLQRRRGPHGRRRIVIIIGAAR